MLKTSDKPEICPKWWSSEKPDDVEGKELKKALEGAEKALADAEKRGDADSIDACLAALASVSSAANKTIKKECDKKKHKELIAVLEKFDRLVQDEVARLEEAKTLAQDAKGEDGEAEDEEEEKGVLKPEYLERMIKRLRSGNELNFCFGLNKDAPQDSCLVLCNKRKPERLYKILKRTGEFSNRLLTYGYATGEGKVMQFRLADDAREPSRIVKLAKEFLKGNRELKYKKVRVLAGGETFEEDLPDVEGTGEGEAVAGATQPATDGAAQPADGASTPEDLRKLFKQARKKWVAVREKAEQDLEIVKDGVRNHYLDDVQQYPIAMKKLKELDAIMDNLSDDLRDALDAYVGTPLKQQDRLQELGANAKNLVNMFVNYVERSELLNAIDQKEFADVEIKRPVSAALRDLAKTIA